MAFISDLYRRFTVGSPITSYHEFVKVMGARITGNSLNDLFERQCGISVDQFTKNNPSSPSKFCNFCLKCFIGGHKHLENHRVHIYKSNGAVCDCGNASIMKESGFCPSHSRFEQKEPPLNSIATDLRYKLRLFIRLVLKYLVEITCDKDITDAKYSANKQLGHKVDVITSWLIGFVSKSSLLVLKVVSEEFLGYRIEALLPIEKILSPSYNPTLLPPLFLDVHFEKIEPVPVIDHIFAFKPLFLRHFLSIYSEHYIANFTRESCCGIGLLSVAYIGEEEIVNLSATGTTKHNIIVEIQRTTLWFIEERLRDYYMTRENRHKFWLRSDLHLVEKMMSLTVVRHMLTDVSDDGIFSYIFRVAASMHTLVAQHTLPHKNTLSFTKDIENQLGAQVIYLLDTAVTPDQVRVQSRRIFAQVVAHNKVYIMKREDIRAHYPMFRLLAITIIKNLQVGNNDILDDLALDQLSLRTMTITIFAALFRQIVYGQRANQTKKVVDYFCEMSTTHDLLMLQVVIIKLGQRSFISCFVEAIACIHPSEQTIVRMKHIMSVLIATIQSRPIVRPSVADIRYHFAQVISSGLQIDMGAYQLSSGPIMHNNTSSKNIGLSFGPETYEEIVSSLNEITVKENKKRMLKKEYWGLVDQYYYLHAPITEPKAAATALAEKRRHQPVVSAVAMPPTSLPPLHPSLLQTTCLVNGPALFDMLFRLLLASHVPDQAIKADPIANLFRNYDSVGECLYIITSSLQTYIEYTIPSLTEEQQTLITSEIDSNLNETSTPSTNQEDTGSSYTIVQLVVLRTTGTDSTMSILNILFRLWRESSASLDQELSPILQQIFTLMVAARPQLLPYFRQHNITLVTSEDDVNIKTIQKKSVSDTRKMRLEQMRQQQAQFLLQATEEVSEDTSIAAPFPDANTLANATANAVDTTTPAHKCIICMSVASSSSDPLYAIGNVSPSALLPHHQRQELERLSHPNRSYVADYKEHIATIHNDVAQAQDSPDDLRNKLPLIFPYIHPTYVTSCHHYVHQLCLIGLNPNYADGFKCALCSAPSNIIMPIRRIASAELSEPVRRSFYQSLVNIDLRDMRTPTVEKYLWKYVTQNIEVLELKSRRMTLYNGANDTPYYTMSNAEFAKEMHTLSMLFQLVMSNTMEFATQRDINQANCDITRAMDPFTSHAFYTYLLHHASPPTSNLYRTINDDFKRTVDTFYTQIIHHYLDSLNRPYEVSIADIKNNPDSHNSLLIETNNLMPFLRKMMIFTMLYNEFKPSYLRRSPSMSPSSSFASLVNMVEPPTSSSITIEQFSSFEFIMDSLDLEPIISFIHGIVVHMAPTIFRNPLEIACYPPPLHPYDSVIKFIDLPDKYFDFLEKYADGSMSLLPDISYVLHRKGLKKLYLHWMRQSTKEIGDPYIA
eukprot:gene16688-19839_t